MPEITQISQEEFDKNMEDVDNEMIDMAMDTLLKSEELEELHQEVKDQYYDIKKILPTSFNDSLDNYINKAQNFNKNVRIKKQQLLQSEKKVLEDILGDSSGEIIFNDLQEERITKKVNNRIRI